jgi:hypothetical protein
VWEDALQGDANAANTALRISWMRIRLLGLDAPHSVEARIDVLSWNHDDTSFIDLRKEVFVLSSCRPSPKTLAKRLGGQ